MEPLPAIPLWDPQRYLEFGDERGRAFVDLVARIPAADPAHVVDLGCGPGNLTRLLAKRWPGASVTGVDSSSEMIDQAHECAAGRRVRYQRADLRTWRADQPVDVLLSNATLQWVPGHLDLLATLMGQVRSGGWFAFQVPGNFAERSHTAIRELVAAPRWAGRLRDAALVWPASENSATYLRVLAQRCDDVDVWESTYLMVLQGKDPVTRWVSGTALRPVLAALDPSDHDEFLADYSRLVRPAYPRQSWGTVLPYRRLFAVGRVR